MSSNSACIGNWAAVPNTYLAGLQIEGFLTAVEGVEEVLFYTLNCFSVKMEKDELYDHAELWKAQY